MVVLIIDEDGILPIEPKCKSPIPINANRPVGRKVFGQSMKLPSGNVHLFGPCGSIQESKLVKELRGMARLNSSLRTGQKELLDPLIPKAAYHFITSVLRNVTLHNRMLFLILSLFVNRPNRPGIIPQLRVHAKIPNRLINIRSGDNFHQRVLADIQGLLGCNFQPVLAR